jgi:hypothetical protein
MITRVAFEFLPAQEAIFRAKFQRAPYSWELDDLRGPVLMVNVKHTPPPGELAISLPPAVAFIDTGADRSLIELEFVTDAYRAANLPLRTQYWTTCAGGFETNHFLIELNGVGLATRSGSIELRRRQDMPGYEHVLIGRDLLARLTLCCSTDTFSLMDTALVQIRVPQGDPCCR